MARVTVEDCLPLVENRFALVLLSTKRTRQLMAGARPVVESIKNKAPVLALREVGTGKVRFDRSVRDALMGKFDKPRDRPMILRPVSTTGPRNILTES
ncbi:MAG: DNA-directed RNA polymerase subunit omega [Deltaproteobacteria bacterium]|nr:DNA-directed RNA polymerase subunit omega [Deltaproteobacteria bacterium]